MALYLFILWFVVLLLCIMIYSLTSQHLKKITEYVQQSIDRFLYDYNLNIYKNKDKFYNWEQALDVIFENQKKFVQAWTYNFEQVDLFVDKFLDDVYYIENLFEKQKIFDRGILITLKSILKPSYYIKKLNLVFYSLSLILSAGIFGLIVKIFDL